MSCIPESGARAVRVVLNPCDNSEQCSGRPIQLYVPLMGGKFPTRLSRDDARQLALDLLELSRGCGDAPVEDR